MDTTIQMFDAEPGLAGVDEVGRGPLAGPVVAAAVCLPTSHGIIGIDDSKKLTHLQRCDLADQIRRVAVSYAVCQASVEEIDTLNILWASMLAMKRAVEGLAIKPRLVRVDGNRVPDLSVPAKALVKGDQRDVNIAAASILAKVHRDEMMQDLHAAYPLYGWNANKGYPTRLHLDALTEAGVSRHHRRSFAPVRNTLCRDRGALL